MAEANDYKTGTLLYVITLIRDNRPSTENMELEWSRDISTRGKTICLTLEEAKLIVENNVVDLSEEGYYNYVVIEEIKSSWIPCLVENEVWYKWEGGKYHGKYIEISKPKRYKHTCNFGIG